jgi:hypothetical protein
MQEEKTKHAKENAKAGLANIMEMVKRLKHCEDCESSVDCDLTDEEIASGLNIHYEAGKTEITDEDRDSYHSADDARQAIEEDPLSVEVRSGWHTPGEKEESMEYKILLGTGGPALQIVGDLDQYNQPESATLQYQDWFTPWIDYYETTSEEKDALLTYAQQFHFGEKIFLKK